MKRFFAICMIVGVMTVGFALFLAVTSSPAAAQRVVSVLNGHKIIYPESSIPKLGRPHTNYFFVDSDKPRLDGPDPNAETPGSLACVYQLVTGPTGCPIATSTNVPSGGVGAIAIVDAGDYPTAASDLAAFDKQFGIPAADFTVVYAGKKPPVYPDWIVEEALDIEWAHSMAPQAKLFLVVSKLCNSGECATDPTWQAITLAAKLVAQNGGGVVSMSFGDYGEMKKERNYDKYFTQPGVVYFAASGDSGIGVSIYPGSSPNVVSVGGTFFNRDPRTGKFVSEVYGGGGGDISPYEPIPSYQSGIKGIVGTHRGYPDIASDYMPANIYVQGSWTTVGGTSWGTPTIAGIVNAAGNRQTSTANELTMLYNELADPTEYKADFNDITQGDSHCKVGWDLCAGIGSPKTYVGK